MISEMIYNKDFTVFNNLNSILTIIVHFDKVFFSRFCPRAERFEFLLCDGIRLGLT